MTGRAIVAATPGSLAELGFAFDFDYALGRCFTDAGGTTPCALTDTIRAARDRCGGPDMAVQATAGARPTLQTDPVTGIVGAYFDGGDSLKVTLSQSRVLSGITVLALVRPTAPTVDWSRLFEWGDGAQDPGSYGGLLGQLNTNNELYVESHGTSIYLMDQRTMSGGVDLVAWHHGWDYGGGYRRMALNWGYDSEGTSAAVGTINLAHLGFGAKTVPSLGNYYTGYIYRVAAYLGLLMPDSVRFQRAMRLMAQRGGLVCPVP